LDFRPQFIVVSGLFGGNPFVDGILGHNLLLSHAFSVGIPSWIGFRLLRSLFSQPVILFTMEFWLLGSPSHELFSFFTMEFWLSGSLSHELFYFFTMDFWLSRSLSHELFSFFTMEFWLLGSLSHEFFFFLTMGFWLSGSLSHEIFSFSRWNSGYQEAFLTNFFLYHNGILEMHDLGENSLYIYIYHKEYLHRICLVKNLAS
jgi:hypothetical protein